ncbi:Carnitine O-acetyltransferase [Aphelenchoides fujianensis]|nr:Carnitine O-acetyltransferase [Aphelenchoides fujianensis]
MRAVRRMSIRSVASPSAVLALPLRRRFSATAALCAPPGRSDFPVGRPPANTPTRTLGLDAVRRQSTAAVAETMTVAKKATGYQTNLPRLPVPKLHETVAKLVHFAKPIQTPAQFKETLRLAAEFERDAKAQKLQELLEARAKSLQNWLTPWWLNVAYLEGRTPLPIVTSPGIALETFPFEGEEGQLEYAAKIIHTVLQYYQAIQSKSLKQDGSAKAPFDMSQYENLIGTTRIPRHAKDELIYGHQRKSRHIFVTRNGHTFWFPVYDVNGNPLGVQQLKDLLRAEVLPKSHERNNEPINLVSGVGREEWAAVYKRLEESNPQLTEHYIDALFVLGLDRTFSNRPGTGRQETLMHQALLGGGPRENAINRWFDKTVQLFLNTNGDIGCTYEHTPAEGPPVANMLDFIQQGLRTNKFPASSGADPLPDVHRLDWKLEEADRQAIEAAKRELDAASADIEVKSLAFGEFGKNVPKAARVSPDSFIQLAFQVAFFRLHGHLPPTYETATLRQFVDGRTDTIRLPNQDSQSFTEAFGGALRSLPTAELCDLLVKAANAHKNYSLMAMNGGGMDRHILGLKLIASDHGLPIPELLRSDAVQRLFHFQVSTSQVPTVFETKMGFGPSAPDCYGVCYNPREQALIFTITAYNSCPQTSARRFGEELERALREMRQLLEDGGRLKTAPKL